MAAVSGSIPNLIGGVSQQPAEIRALNTSTALSNTWSDVATGLSTRPCGRYIGSIASAPTGSNSVATHIVNKPSGRYQIAVHGGSVFVTDLVTGAAQTVTVESGGAYINAADAARNIGFVTVGDTTFIYNRAAVVSAALQSDGTGLDGLTEETVVRKNPYRTSTVWVRQKAGYDAGYSVYRDGIMVAEHWATSDSNVSVITNGLYTTLSGVTGITTSRPSRTVIGLVHAVEGRRTTTEDGYGNQALRSYDESINEFTDLPNNDIEGRMVLIKHSPEDQADDYWVWRKKGYWEETYGWNAKETLVASTMPVILVDNKNGTWTLKQTTWGGRTVGDTKSNPTPTFVGRTINHMFIHKNRMCILTDENFVASRVGEFEQFYRATCTQLLDDEPIDIAAPEGAGGPLYHAREFDRGLLLFSEFDQFKIEGDGEGLLSPNTVSIKHANSYNCSAKATPVYIGPDLLFVDDFGPTGYATLREYQIERVFGREVALPVTDQVPEYIPSGVYKMVSSSTDSVVVVLSTGDRRKAWVYNYYFNSEGKVQSAWQEWVFPGNVMSAEFHGDKLVVTLVFANGLRVLEYQFHTGASAELNDDDVLMDFRMTHSQVSITYDGTASTISTPFSLESDSPEHIRLTVSPENTAGAIPGRVLVPDEINGANLRFNGVDLTGQRFFVGRRYQFRWKLSPIYMRDNNLVAIQDGRLQLRKVSLMYNDSGPFEAIFIPTGGRDTYTATFSGWVVGSSTTTLNQLRMNSGEFRISVNGASEVLDLEITAWTPWRVRFSSVEWDGRFRPRKRRTT